MKKSEYIIWRCETREEVKKKHPDWKQWQIEQFLNGLEAIYKIEVDKE